MNRLRLRVRLRSDGNPVATWLLQEGDAFALVDDSSAGDPAPVSLALPPPAVSAVFHRYGRPLDVPLPALLPDDAFAEVPVALGVAGTIRGFSYRAPVDVIENDYLVLESPGRETLCAPAQLLAEALLAIARAGAALPESDF